MQRLISSFLLLALATAGAQPVGSKPGEIVNRKYGFSLVRPKGWFVFQSGDLPSFLQLSRRNDVSTGRASSRGGRIKILATPSQHIEGEGGPLRAWALSLAIAARGADIHERAVPNPVREAKSMARWVEYDQPPLGDPGDTLHRVLIAWQAGNKFFGAQLTMLKGDPRSQEHERVALELVRSFRNL